MPLAVSSIHCLLWGDLESLTCQGYNFNSSIPVAKQKYQSNTTRSKVKALPGLHRGQINLTKLTYWILNILNIICTFWNWYSFVIAFTCFKLPEFVLTTWFQCHPVLVTTFWIASLICQCLMLSEQVLSQPSTYSKITLHQDFQIFNFRTCN